MNGTSKSILPLGALKVSCEWNSQINIAIRFLVNRAVQWEHAKRALPPIDTMTFILIITANDALPKKLQKL